MSTDNKIQHLQFIQNVIARMSTTSAVIKGFSITVTIGICTQITTDMMDDCAKFTLLLPLLALMLLDTYYLYLERNYRIFYDEIREEKLPADFSMSLSNITKENYFNCLKSISIWLFYAFVFLIHIILLNATS
jgi:hypothetical protein